MVSDARLSHLLLHVGSSTSCMFYVFFILCWYGATVAYMTYELDFTTHQCPQFYFIASQAVAGERFVDFKSDTDTTTTTTTNDDTFNLSSVSSSIPINNSGMGGVGSGSGDSVIGSPARGVNSGSFMNSGSLVNSGSYICTSGIANYSASSRNRNINTNTNTNTINTSSSVPNTPTKHKQSLFNPTTTNTNTSTTTTYELWERCAPSRTGTCLSLCAGTYYKQQAVGPLSPDSISGGGTTSAAKGLLAPLVLTWRGQEPLDKLHLSLRVSGCFVC